MTWLNSHRDCNRPSNRKSYHQSCCRVGGSQIAKVIYATGPAVLSSSHLEVLLQSHDSCVTQRRFIEELEHVRQAHDRQEAAEVSASTQ